MAPSQHIVFVELHKTGSTRVRKLLAEVAGTDAMAKLPDTADALADLGQPVVGYVCDPLIWYLAVWQLGCSGKGELFKRLVDPARWAALRARQSARIPEPGKEKSGPEVPAHWGAEHARSVWYGNPEDPAAFKEWLQAVLDTRGLRRLVSNAYQTSGIQKFAGLMTFEYITTFVRGSTALEKWVDSHGALLALNEKKAITRHFVRSETPGTDLLRVLGELGLAATEEQVATAHAWDQGAARHNWHIDTFYDAEARQLVLRRDKLIFKLFGYAGLTTEAIVPAVDPLMAVSHAAPAPGAAAAETAAVAPTRRAATAQEDAPPRAAGRKGQADKRNPNKPKGSKTRPQQPADQAPAGPEAVAAPADTPPAKAKRPQGSQADGPKARANQAKKAANQAKKALQARENQPAEATSPVAEAAANGPPDAPDRRASPASKTGKANKPRKAKPAGNAASEAAATKPKKKALDKAAVRAAYAAAQAGAEEPSPALSEPGVKG